MKLSELRAILELSQLTHPGNSVLVHVRKAVRYGYNHVDLGAEDNVQALLDLVPDSVGKPEYNLECVRLVWEPD